MIDDWYAVEAVDALTFAINEPKSSQYNTSYLIVGDTQAIMFDAGSSERPAGFQSMREVAERYTDKPITLILSHFHYDHIYDAAKFDSVILIDRPEIRANIRDDSYSISAMESVDAEMPPLAGVIADGDVIELGGRRLDVLNLPGHTTESVVLIDRGPISPLPVISSTSIWAVSSPLRRHPILRLTRQTAPGCCNSQMPTRCFSVRTASRASLATG